MKQALLYSGGVESTLLYYELLKNANKNSSLNLFIVDRHNAPVQKAQTLYYMLKKSFRDEISTCQVLKTPDELDNARRMMWAVQELSVYYDKIYWGVNAYPPDILPKRDIFKNAERKLKKFPGLRLPYLNMTKDKILEQYIKYNITWILEYTHSCGEPVDNPCTKCFNCRERAWAYQQLGLELKRGV